MLSNFEYSITALYVNIVFSSYTTHYLQHTLPHHTTSLLHEFVLSPHPERDAS